MMNLIANQAKYSTFFRNLSNSYELQKISKIYIINSIPILILNVRMQLKIDNY